MDTETRALWTDVARPPTSAGVGLLRYAAAMAFYQRGEITDDVLEVYRICARLDGDDPLDVLTLWCRGADWVARVRNLRQETGD